MTVISSHQMVRIVFSAMHAFFIISRSSNLSGRNKFVPKIFLPKLIMRNNTEWTKKAAHFSTHNIFETKIY